MRPPPRSSVEQRRTRPRSSDQPRGRRRRRSRPPSGVIPQPARRSAGPLDEHAGHRAAGTAAASALVPNHGANESRHQSVRVPSPGSISAMSVIAPSDQQRDARRSSGRRRGVSCGARCRRRVRRRGVRGAASGCGVGARVARGHRLRPRPRPGRPSAGASSARTGSARRPSLIWVLSRAISLMWSPGRVDRARSPARRASSMIGSCSLRWTKPRVTISGRPTTDAGLLVDGDHDHEHAVVGERAPVAQDDVADLADRQPVDEDVAGRRPASPRRAEPSAKNSIGVPFSMMKTFSGATPGLDRQAAVLDLHPELAVDRDEVLAAWSARASA